MYILEDFVLKNIKYPYGDLTQHINYYQSLNETHFIEQPPISFQQSKANLDPNERLQENYQYEITEQDKQYIYTLHAQGKFKETPQQKQYRETAIQKVLLSNDPNDTVDIPLIDRLPRYYDDILTSIIEFHQAEVTETDNLKMIEALRKKAFFIYAMHHDCQNLQTIPKELYPFFEKIHNGYEQRDSIELIRQSFLQYAEMILLNDESTKNISSTTIKDIIKLLEKDSIPFVKEAFIAQDKLNISILHAQTIRLESAKKSVAMVYTQDSQIKSQPLFADQDYFVKQIRKIRKLISTQTKKMNYLVAPTANAPKSIVRKKFTGSSAKWLKNHKVNNQHLYDVIKEIAKKNRKSNIK
ncbi:hypothetical protein ACINWC323_3628 [Acinetobacter sp. WC-323]|nr:hypothetical protein ACINWC323_3628 [Acinetobacter sp. WC-323]